MGLTTSTFSCKSAQNSDDQNSEVRGWFGRDKKEEASMFLGRYWQYIDDEDLTRSLESKAEGQKVCVETAQDPDQNAGLALFVCSKRQQDPNYKMPMSEGLFLKTVGVPGAVERTVYEPHGGSYGADISRYKQVVCYRTEFNGKIDWYEVGLSSFISGGDDKHNHSLDWLCNSKGKYTYAENCRVDYTTLPGKSGKFFSIKILKSKPQTGKSLCNGQGG